MLRKDEIIEFWGVARHALTVAHELLATDSEHLKSLGREVRRTIMDATEHYMLGDMEKADNEMQRVVSLLLR